MVKHLIKIISLALILGIPALAEIPTEVSFKMEFSKPEIYVGEQVLCSFNVYTPNELIEVEVAKFPEFRGYWNENLMLRQGPISTMFGLSAQPNTGTVGTYVLIPMLGQKNPTIEPMKIVLRSPSSRRVEGSTPPDFILSQAMPLKIKPLPPVPALMDPKKFFGAVGRFNLSTPPGSVLFQPGEPTMVSFQLNGQGNFQDLNELPIAWPPEVSVVSSRTYIQGGAQVASKTFEYNLTTKQTKDFALPATDFLYFDPDTAKYEKLYVPEVRFAFSNLKGSVSAKEAEPLPNYQLRESFRVQKSGTAGYIWLGWMNVLFFSIVGLGVAMKLLKKPPKIPATEEIELARAFERLEQELLKQDARAFLAAAESYVFFWIAYRLGIRAGMKSRRELLASAEGKLSPSQLKIAARLNEISSQLLYSPAASQLPNLNELRVAVDSEFPPPNVRLPVRASAQLADAH